MKKVKLTIDEHNYGVNFQIKNIEELDMETIALLQNFAIKRNGYFRKNLAKFDIKRKLPKKDILQVFELLELDFEIIEEQESIENLTPVAEVIVEFGKYKGFKWKDVPLHYLEWLYKESENQHAYAEIKRRRHSSVDITDKVIKFGKFNGKKWVDLPEDYLQWALAQFSADKEAHKFAKLALAHQKNS